MSAILTEPFTLPCGVTIGNRLAKSALTERLADASLLPNQKHYRLYDYWARHGAGLLISGNIIVDHRYLESNGNVVIEEDTPLEPFKTWTEVVTGYGNQFWAQLSHAGRQSNRFTTTQPVSASDVKLK